MHTDLEKFKTPTPDRSANFVIRCESELKTNLYKISEKEEISFNELVLRFLRASVTRYIK